MEFFGLIERIYKDRDYLTRKRAAHLFVFDIAAILLGISSAVFLWFTKGEIFRVGFTIMTFAASLSFLLLIWKRFEFALNIILFASILSVSIGWFLGIPNAGGDVGNKNIVLSIFIMIFLYFTDVKKTIFIMIYGFILIFIDEFYLKEHEIIYTADRIGLFFMFTVILILTVKTLSGSIQEKNELIQEIHHRVRNNLQVISGLVEMHSGSDKANTQIILSDFQNRILAISEVHNYLYKSENYFEIDFAEVMDKIILGLSNKLGKRSVKIENKTESTFLRIENAIPCAMIFNELLSNSLKHAFHSEKGRIQILFRKEGDIYRLQVSDNGSGIKDSKIWLKPKTAGFTLIQILTKQMKGRFQIFSDSGFTTVLEFISI
ncbi:sensor histidine kinase [Leptospira alstonii]|uniref:histidine kinase n=2 Tax=Leptospira alstonii TaxID=28452 RepID=M6CLQ9_9LEPT|nr:sensor histidine kinase [Leptospira alstonii]EMJ91481.1 histidine kinase [Leptospira alstonii serovar Sichuan str. 79601]EQA82405.1 histidine kinase [Leptospira alstonii serovar Pingchang str. 80-412]